MALLEIRNLHAKVAEEDKVILRGINLDVNPGEVHAIMGPNGSGKSTLANVLAGREVFEVTEGSVTFDGKDLLELEPHERACEGIFMAFQYPVEIPGVSNTYFLRAAVNARRKAQGLDPLDAMDFMALLREKLNIVHLKRDLLERPVNEGFSGGEKKRNEIFQMAVLDPRLAILDETDSVRHEPQGRGDGVTRCVRGTRLYVVRTMPAACQLLVRISCTSVRRQIVSRASKDWLTRGEGFAWTRVAA